ncbi:MAG: hypothetical protein EAZ55_01660 [Cytophagales bacterium]|nr:MAG: hypothetical protein EAZ55_01660 [Cytophagales bacterium]
METIQTPLIIDLQYLPPTHYWQKIIQHNNIYLDDNETYQKQTYKNRCYILTSQGKQLLSIPIQKNTNQKVKDTKIDYSEKWHLKHIRSLQAAYGKSPFYEFIAPEIFSLLEKKIDFLADLNHQLMTTCLKLLKISPTLQRLSEANLTAEKIIETAHYQDLRNTITPPKKNTPTNPTTQKTYPQVFGNAFVQELSIIDLLFCQGNQAQKFLRQITNP